MAKKKSKPAKAKTEEMPAQPFGVSWSILSGGEAVLTTFGAGCAFFATSSDLSAWLRKCADIVDEEALGNRSPSKQHGDGT